MKDGTLGDDERTETEQSPVVKIKSLSSKDVSVGVSVGDTSSNGDTTGCNSAVDIQNDKVVMKQRRNRRKGKGGKHHQKKWKPYSKLTWEEKKVIDDKESIRANQRREERFSMGQPMAPYNTTQFLMDQHPASDPNTNTQFKLPENQTQNENRTRTAAPLHSISGEASGSLDSSDEYYSSPDDEEIFLQKDFSEAYDDFHAERLQTMTKDDLVREYLELETKVERLEKNASSSRSSSRDSHGELEEAMDIATGGSNKFEEELRKLKTENERLKKENEVLRAGVINNVNFDNKENNPQS